MILPENYEDKIDLTKYFDKFYRSMQKMKRILILCIVVMIVLFELKTIFFFQTTYSSEAVFVVYTQDQNNIFASRDSDDEMFATFRDLMCGNMMREVIQKETEADVYNAQITLSQLSDTNLVELRVISDDAQRSYQIADSILNHYGQVTQLVMSDVEISVIDTPVVAQEPDALPQYVFEAVKGCIGGLVIDFVIVLMTVLFRHTIIDSDDVKNILHMSCITKIPCVGIHQKKSRGSRILLSNPRIQYSFKGAFHDLRLRLEQEKNKNQYQVFMVASVLPNEGKSTTAVNTAISLAQKGHSVILVDLDLRNPSVYQILKDPSISGNISDYLQGRFCLDEVINQYQDYPMDVIYGMESCEDATEILSSEQFVEFVKLLREKYEFVIFDVPPLYMLEDAMIIGRYCDSSLIVVKQDYVQVNKILDVLEELNEHIPHISGVVINQAKPSLFHKEREAYGYGYK